MELKEIRFAVAPGAPGWVVVQASDLEKLRELAAGAQTVTRDWPQILTDEDMSGADAVDWIGRLSRCRGRMGGAALRQELRCRVEWGQG